MVYRLMTNVGCWLVQGALPPFLFKMIRGVLNNREGGQNNSQMSTQMIILQKKSNESNLELKINK